MTIRTRLTLVTAGLVALVLFLFSVLFYWLLTASLVAEVDRTLERFTVEAHRALGHTDGSSWQQHTVQVDLASLPVNEYDAPGVYVQVVDDRGAVLAVSADLPGDRLPLDPDSVNAALRGRSVTAEVTAAAGERLRVLTTPVLVDGQAVGLVQVAQSLHTMDDTTDRVRLLLIAGVLLATNLAGIAAYGVAGRALTPVTQMAHTAQRIAVGDDLGQRIDLTGSRDELDMLAGTLNSMLERLQAAFRSQQDFIADSSHELRTPLTIIRGNLDLLSRADDPSERAEILAAIGRETARMSDMVNDLLLLARLQGAPPTERELVDIDAVVADVFTALRPVAAERDFGLGDVEALQVWGDRDQLRRMLLNLAGNALKYAGPGARIRISATAIPPRTGQQPDTAVLKVSDNGHGIPPEELPHIFDRFHRAGRPSGARSAGAGLGLAIAMAIARAHDGDLSVESTPGGWTTFTARLPLSLD